MGSVTPLPPILALVPRGYALTAPADAYSGVTLARRYGPAIGLVVDRACGVYPKGQQSKPIGYRNDGLPNTCSMRGLDDSDTIARIWNDWATVPGWKAPYIRPPALTERTDQAWCQHRSGWLKSLGFSGVLYDALGITQAGGRSGPTTPARFQALTDHTAGLLVGVNGSPTLPEWSAGEYAQVQEPGHRIPDGAFTARFMWLQGSIKAAERLQYAHAALAFGFTLIIDLANITPAAVDALVGIGGPST